jgi:transcriptional regulator with XRE-family HTH domain
MQDPIGQRIRLIRKSYYNSQTELADAVKLTQSAIARAEKDGSLSKELVLFMRNTHNININWLYTGEDPMLISEDNSDAKALKEEIRTLERSLLVINEQLSFYLKKNVEEGENKEVGT